MNINIYTKNKIKNKNIITGTEEYLKRLSKYCKISILTKKKKQNESDMISNASYPILISSDTSTLSSEELSRKISKFGIDGVSEIDFFIDFESHDDFSETISLSSFNLDPEIKALVLIEQIYRAYRIINNEPYHK